MMMIEDFKKNINNFLKEIQENTGKQLEALKEETQKSLKELQENKQIGEEKEQNHPRSKNGTRNNKEITKGDNPVIRKSRKVIRRHRIKHHQQNARDRRKKSQAQKIPKKILTQQLKKIQSANILAQNIQEIQDTKRPNLRIIEI